MGNTLHGTDAFTGLTPDCHSIIIPVSFFGCKCEPQLLRGKHRGRLIDGLRHGFEDAGFAVIGESIQPFGHNTVERAVHGATMNLILEDSGVSFDVYPDADEPNGTVQMNLHYCNIRNNNDSKVANTILAVKGVLRPIRTIRYGHRPLPIQMAHALTEEMLKGTRIV